MKYKINEWDDEPDRKHWIDEETGLDCLIVRGASGALCGYVGVPNIHALYGRKYSEIDADLDVHGGLTFSDKCHGAICHSEVIDGKIANHDVWWLGFDCCHSYDLWPLHYKYPAYFGGSIYRNIKYVEQQCRSLAAQIASL